VIEKIFQRWSEEVDHQYVVQTFLAKVIHIGNAGASNQNLVRSVLIAKLRSVALSRFKLDSDLLIVEKICAFENNAKRSLSNLFPHPIVYTDHV
jgi:uncharacterized protein YjfI (DUF2170 family)